VKGIDWSGLLTLGLGRLGLHPDQFWRLTPLELRMMVGADGQGEILTRTRLDELSRTFPDMTEEEDHG
jgi:uncharacterized phage protein (TIGR02216 family)